MVKRPKLETIFWLLRALILEDWRHEPCWLGLPSRDRLWLWDTPPSVHCQMRVEGMPFCGHHMRFQGSFGCGHPTVGFSLGYT